MMTMDATVTGRGLLRTLLLLTSCSLAVAQAPRWERVDGPSLASVAFDATRTRLVALDALGGTYEWSGVWHRVPAIGPSGFAKQLVHDPVHRCTLALGDAFLSRYDGVVWTAFPPPVPVGSIQGLAFDLGRSRLVALAS